MVRLQTSQHMEITSGGNPKWPGDFLSFLSDLWGGCVSDKQITRESGVEREAGVIKTYHILDRTLPITLSPCATQTATVCGLVTNFLPPLLLPANL